MAALSLVFDLIGRDVSASRAFKDVGDAADKAGKSGEGVGHSISSGMKLAGAALLGGGIIEGFKSLYEQAAESAKIGRITTQVIISTGGAAKITADQVGALATAISNKTGVDDEAIQSGENLLLTFTNVKNEVGKGNDVFNQATQIITDMSVALGQDTSSSAIQLGKALNDPIKGVTALQKVGVSFTSDQKEQIKTLVESGNVMGAQKVILGELTREFGGAAAAASTPFDKLQVTLGNLAEQLGGYIIPIVDKFANFMLHNVLPAVSGVAGWVADHLGPAFRIAGDAISGIASIVGDVVRWFSDLPGPIQLAVGALGAVALLKGPVSSTLTIVKDFAETAALKLMYLGSAGQAAKSGLGGVSGALGGPWGLAIGAATAAVGFLVEAFNQEDDATKAAAAATKTLTSALNESKGAIDDNVRLSAAQAAQQEGLFDAANRWGVSTKTVTDAILGNGDAMTRVKAGADNYRGSLDGLAGTTNDLFGKAGEAQQKSDSWLSGLQKLAGTTAGTTKDQQELAQAAGAAGTSIAGAVGPTSLFTAELDAAAKSADDAKKQTDAFKLSLDILTGAHVNMIQVESAFDAAVAGAAEAMTKEGGAVLDASGALDLHSANGRKAADVLLSIKDSGNQLISTMINQGATTDQVTAKDAQLRESFIKSAMQMGANRQNAESLANQILGIPGERNTKIDADTKQAAGDVAGFQSQVDNLHGKNVVVTVSGQGGLASYTTDQRNILYSGKALGGAIFGPGSGTSDTAGLFALSNGEHVWTAKEVSAAGGHAAVESMRKAVLGAGRGMADGGPVYIRTLLDSTQVDAMAAAALKAAQAAASSFTSAGGNAGNRALGQQIANAMGFGGQFSAIDYVFSHESGWNNNAQNPTSTAYGIPQFLNATWAAYGGKTSDPGVQIRDGIRYMVDRYGSPNGAASFWQGHHWYDGGGWLQPGVTMAMNGTGRPERIRTAEQESALQRQLAGPMELTGTLRIDGDGLAHIVDGRLEQTVSLLTTRAKFNGAAS